MDIKDRIELDQSQIIKKSLTLLGFLLLFCIISVPCYFLMTAGTVDVTNEVTAEKSIKDGPETEEGSRNIFGGGNQSADTGAGEDGFDNDFGPMDEPSEESSVFDPGEVKSVNGGVSEGEDFSGEENGSEDYFEDEPLPPGAVIPGMIPGGTSPSGDSGNLIPEEIEKLRFRLNGFAFFGGMLLAMILYVVYFEAVLKKRFRELMQGEKIAMAASLVALLLFVLTQFIAVTFIPNRITRGLSSFTGIPWEIAYAVPVFYAFFTLIGTWVDTNLNHTVYLDDIPFHYVQFGKGAKNLILIPGLSTLTLEGKGISLAWQFRDFAKDYTVYVMDKRDELKEDVTLRELAEDIAGVIDHIGLLSADVVGVSQGGMISQYLTIDNPDLVDKLVLAVTASRLNDSVKNYVNQCVILAQKGEMEEINRVSFENDFTEEYTKPLKPFLPLLCKISVPKSNVRFIRLARSINSLDTYDELEKIKCPVFVIGAGKDRIVTADASNEIAEKLQCKKYIFQRYGHGVYSEAKDFNQKIYRFLMTGK